MSVDIEDLVRRRDKHKKPCVCVECRRLCSRVPGLYDPKHLLALLQDGRVKMQDIAERLIEYYFYREREYVLILRPRNVNEWQEAYAQFTAPFGPCTFLGSRGCSLKRDEMPYGCISAYGCHRHTPIYFSLRECKALWDTDCGRLLIRLFEAHRRKQRPHCKVGTDGIHVVDEQFNHLTAADIQEFEMRLTNGS